MVGLMTYALGRDSQCLYRVQVSGSTSPSSVAGDEGDEIACHGCSEYASSEFCRSSSQGSEGNKDLSDATRLLFELKETSDWALCHEATSLTPNVENLSGGEKSEELRKI